MRLVGRGLNGIKQGWFALWGPGSFPSLQSTSLHSEHNGVTGACIQMMVVPRERSGLLSNACQPQEGYPSAMFTFCLSLSGS